MKHNHAIGTALVLLIALAGCRESSEPQDSLSSPSANFKNNTIEIQRKRKVDITDPYGRLEVEQLPPLLKMSDEQRIYVIKILAATGRVIEGTTELEIEEEKTFGKGEYFWPKDPKAPVKRLKSYFSENFKVKSMSLSFGRVAEGLQWVTAGLSIHPKNFPNSIYQMDLPAKTFAEYQLVESELSLRTNGSIKRVNVFHYIKKNDKRIKMVLEATEGVSSLKEIYPSSFHAIQFQKLD